MSFTFSLLYYLGLMSQCENSADKSRLLNDESQLSATADSCILIVSRLRKTWRLTCVGNYQSSGLCKPCRTYACCCCVWKSLFWIESAAVLSCLLLRGALVYRWRWLLAYLFVRCYSSAGCAELNFVQLRHHAFLSSNVSRASLSDVIATVSGLRG